MTNTVAKSAMHRNLPDGWRWVRLREIASCGPDNGIFKRRGDFGNGVRIVNVSDLFRSFYVDLSLSERVCVTQDELKRYEVLPGDLLFCRSSLKREGIGWCCLMEEMHEPAVFECHVMRVRLSPTHAIPEYVALYWQHPAVRASVIGNSRTATMTTMNQQDLASVMIPLPPIENQRRIVELLRERMMAVEWARAATLAQLQAALALPAAVAREALLTGRTRKYVLGDCLVEIKHGVGADWSKYPVFGATRDGLAPGKEGVGKAPERYKLVDPVTVFYNPMRILLGSIAIVDEGNPAGITSPDYVVVKGRPGILDTRWFYYWFRSTPGAHLIDSLSRGAVRERILFNRLAAGEINLPDFETQLRASDQMKHVGVVVENITEQLQTIEALPPAVLREAFGGNA